MVGILLLLQLKEPKKPTWDFLDTPAVDFKTEKLHQGDYLQVKGYLFLDICIFVLAIGFQPVPYFMKIN